jgi:hypothetical protein
MAVPEYGCIKRRMEQNTINTPRGPITARILSVLLHPVFMPLVSCLMLYYLWPAAFAKNTSKELAGWLGMIIINTILFPVIFMLLLKGLGFISSIYLRNVKERVIPLIGTMVFYFWPYLVGKNVHAPLAANVLLLGNFWGITLVFLITIFMKVSMHTAGIGSVLGFVFVLMLLMHSFLAIPLAIVLAAAALTGWARYRAGAHQPAELWLGFAVGIACQLGAYLYL